MTEIIKYSPELCARIVMTRDQLPGPRPARYLECVRGEGDKLIAKEWHRSIPRRYEVLIALVSSPKPDLVIFVIWGLCPVLGYVVYHFLHQQGVHWVQCLIAIVVILQLEIAFWDGNK
jgi:hypothetical protein